MRRMRDSVRSLAAAAALMLVFASPTAGYGGGADHDMWQVGFSLNCNTPEFCGPELGGFWAWVEFDRSTDGSETWGDLEGSGCGHTLGGGGFAGASHVSIEIESWSIGPGSGGPATFFASGEETDSFRGQKVTYSFVNEDTGIPATPGHYTASQIFGFDPPPGVALQIQVAFRPAN